MPQFRVRVTCIVWDGSHSETVGLEYTPPEEHLAWTHKGDDIYIYIYARIAQRRVHTFLDRRVDAIDREGGYPDISFSSLHLTPCKHDVNFDRNMQQGVRHMAYCSDHRLIVSGGFSFDLVISNQYESTPISRLHGHTASIVGVDHLKGTHQASYMYWSYLFQRGGPFVTYRSRA